MPLAKGKPGGGISQTIKQGKNLESAAMLYELGITEGGKYLGVGTYKVSLCLKHG
jgi:hypothetical protein